MIAAFVFPARAGMSRRMSPSAWSFTGFPRTRGDEPARVQEVSLVSMFSPHARG